MCTATRAGGGGGGKPKLVQAVEPRVELRAKVGIEVRGVKVEREC